MNVTSWIRTAIAPTALGLLVAAGCGDSGTDTNHAPTKNPGHMESGGETRGASSTGPAPASDDHGQGPTATGAGGTSGGPAGGSTRVGASPANG